MQEERDRWYDEKQHYTGQVEARRTGGGGGGGRSNSARRATPAGASQAPAVESAWASGPLPRDRMTAR
jgi:hypothetical protein